MTCCLNPACEQPQNPDDVEFCLSCGAKLVPLMRGRYRVLRPLGQGGFGKTYLAVDEDRLSSRCVIKQFSPQVEGSKALEKAVRLFDQEAVRLHELGEHPQIPTLLAYFEHDKRLYLVQQFVEGATLLQEMQQTGIFNEQKVRALLAGILPVLKYVHDHQVIHRDITPSNVIRRKSDNKLVLIDFGVAKLLSAETAAQPGTKIGTEGYAPMEQLRSGKAYPASDIYSLGATCLYLMTRTKPDDLYDPLEGRWLWQKKFYELGMAISPGMANILDKMLKDLVNERYQSADAVMRDLRIVLSQPVAALPKTAALGQATSIGGARPAAITSKPPSSHSPQVPVSSPNAPPPPSPIPVSGSQRRCLMTLTDHTRWVLATAISPDGQLLATAGLDDVIRLWNLLTGDRLRLLSGHTKAVNCLAFSPDGQWLVSGSDDHTLRLWHVASGKLLKVLMGHSRDITSVCFHPSGQTVVSGSEDRSARSWNLMTGETERLFPELAGIVRSVAVSPNGQALVCGKLDNQIKLWNLSTGAALKVFAKGHFNAVNGVLVTPDGKSVVSASKDKTIKIWNLSTGEVIRTLTGHTDAVNAIALSSDGKRLISGSSDKTLRLWHMSTGSLLATLSEHANAVNTVAITADGRMAVSGSSDNTVRVWQI